MDIQFILVLYNCPLAEAASFVSLSNALLNSKSPKADIYIYDNSPVKQNLASPFADLWHITYFHDPTNPGVSKAYNQGAEYAKSNSKKWLMMLDQDTDFPLHIFEVLYQDLTTYKEEKLFAPILKSGEIIVSPSIYRFKRGFCPKTMTAGPRKLQGFSPVNSGMVIDTDLFFQAGGYDERIPLDFSDFVFVERLRNYISIFVVLNAICSHSLSSASKPSISSAKFRYEVYCRAARVMSCNVKDVGMLFTVCFLRGIKLSLSYNSANFLNIFFRCYLKK